MILWPVEGEEIDDASDWQDDFEAGVAVARTALKRLGFEASEPEANREATTPAVHAGARQQSIVPIHALMENQQ